MERNASVDFARINQVVQAHAVEFCQKHLPGGRILGNEYVAGDLQGGSGESCRVNLTSGKWADFAGTEKGGDLVSLLAAKRGVTQVEAARELVHEYGVADGGAGPHKPGKAEGLTHIAPVPGNAPERPAFHSRYGRPAMAWTYRDAESHVLFHVYRFDPAGGKKQVLPVTLWMEGTKERYVWRFKGYPEPRPLYGLDRLAKTAPAYPVLIPEGEKAADAAGRLVPKAVAMTWPGGGKAVGKADFGPLAGRRVTIWPDADKPGFEAALDVAAMAKQIGATEVVIVPPPDGVTPGWDLADAEVEGWDERRVVGHIQAHKLDVDAFAALAQERYGIERTVKAPEPDAAAVKTDSKRGLVVLDVAEFLRLEIPQRSYVLQPIIPTQGLAMLYALRGIGKTYMAMHLAYAVASGQKVFRWVAPTPRKVLYLDGEMPGVTMQERLAGIVNSYSKEALPGFMRILNPDLQPDFMPNLATPEGQALLAPYLEGVELLIVDNISTLCRHGRENESEGWLPVQEWILSLRRRGMSALLVHHANKSGGQRGTSSREDVLDTVISLRRPQDYRPEEGARFEVHLEKARGIIGDDAKPFEAKLTQVGDAQVWTCRDLEDMELEMVSRLHAEGLPIRDIAEETGLSKSKVGRLVKRLKQEAA